MLRIAVVEDDMACTERMREYITRYREEQKLELEAVYFSDGLDIVDGYQPIWDIIFMDIKMKHLNGMEAAAKIRKVDASVVLIFITTMAQFAIHGYEVGALDFVLKPIRYNQFHNKMIKAMNVVEKLGKRKYFFLGRDEVQEKISTDLILYIEVKNHNLYFVTGDYTYSRRGTMAEIEKELEGYHFARCNQSYLVNLKNVTRVEKDSVVTGGRELPFSRARKKQFLQELSDYVEAGYQ